MPTAAWPVPSPVHVFQKAIRSMAAKAKKSTVKKSAKPAKAKKPAAASAAPAAKPAPSRDQISARAHQIWIDEGRPSGKSLEHWYRAERELGA